MSADGEQGGVTQADRVVAAELLGGAAPDGLLEGRRDSLSLVQTLMRHRLAHSAPATDTSEVVRLRTILSDLERSATAVYRNGAVPGPQWSLLGGALIRARAALAKHPTSPEDAA